MSRIIGLYAGRIIKKIERNTSTDFSTRILKLKITNNFLEIFEIRKITFFLFSF